MKRLFGGLLLAVGLLIMTGSGLCSIAVIVAGSMQPSFSLNGLVPFLLYACVPFASGWGLFQTGRRMLRQVDAGAKVKDETLR